MQLINIESIFITFSILNKDKSNDFKDSQLPNIKDILVTLLVLNDNKSNDSKDLHS